MKIGFSLSKCVLDIVQGTVDYDDVLVIVSGTKFNPGNRVELESVWTGYTQGRGFTPSPWRLIIDQEGKTKHVVTSLYLENSPAMRDAWQTFQVIAGLSQ